MIEFEGDKSDSRVKNLIDDVLSDLAQYILQLMSLTLAVFLIFVFQATYGKPLSLGLGPNSVILYTLAYLVLLFLWAATIPSQELALAVLLRTWKSIKQGRNAVRTKTEVSKEETLKLVEQEGPGTVYDFSSSSNIDHVLLRERLQELHTVGEIKKRDLSFGLVPIWFVKEE
ncbi:hypothetical protein C5C07_13985 [Haloferax sp. Atlit-4N]|uniref:hypothetical protein n=1 Tax=Haloferax sp. Atlit-4N TaxID=2077206 RepID=UPI000E2599E1|nr:hypothetical protein [Haloferax sp. Atlit-4N]RDZ52862.1 hypothetical protein C5C07_13985 [Haloferax sp. Atlit-4N]